MNPQDAWYIAYNQLEIQFDRASFNTWLRDLSFLKFEEDVFYLGVDNTYALETLQHRMDHTIRRILTDAYGGKVDVHFELIKPKKKEESETEMPLFRYLAQQTKLPTEEEIKGYNLSRPEQPPLPESELNPRFTFDRFIVNRANTMAYEAARAVAEDPNGAYNPLMVYGGVGLGKTHLLQSIAHECQDRGYHVIYVPSEAFTNDLVMSIRKKQQAMFREKYRSADVLIVDDVQFIAGKESTQEEFFHTFNALYTFNKQIVLASDRHPDQLATLEDRLRSRFAGGLIVDVQPPEMETRIAIMEMWANERGIPLDQDIAEMIVHKAPDNIRELEGVFNQVMAKARFATKGRVNMEMATRTLNRFNQPRNPFNQPITVDRIVRETAEAFNTNPDVLYSKRRTKRVSAVRQIAMYLARELTDASLPQIGDIFGGRTHSTVLHSCNKAAEEMEQDPALRERVEALRRQLEGL